MSDGNGNFKSSLELISDSISIHAPLFNEVKVSIDPNDSIYQINLPNASFFLPLKKSESKAEKIVRRLQDKSFQKSEERSLNALRFIEGNIASDDIRKFKNMLNPYMILLGERINYFDREHYVLHHRRVESIEQKNSWNRKICIGEINSIGTKYHEDLYQEFNFDDFSPNQDFLKIAGRFYPNPIKGNFNKRYLYQIEEVVQLFNGDSLAIIKFYPSIFNKTDKLRGFLYINLSKNILMAWTLQSSSKVQSRFTVSSTFHQLDSYHFINELWFYKNLKIRSLAAGLEKHLYQRNELLSDEVPNWIYPEKILDLNQRCDIKESSSNDSAFSRDSIEINTERFYEKNVHLRKYYGKIDIGAKFLEGEIPIGKFNLDISKSIDFNEFEEFRTGLGISTNEKFNQNLFLNSYLGYGFRDERIKNGHGLKYYITESNFNFFQLDFRNDLMESGNMDILFEPEKMFKSENLRKYRLSIFDRERGLQAYLNFRLLKNLQIQPGIRYQQLMPTYNYSFNGNQLNNVSYTEYLFGVKLSPRSIYFSRGRTTKRLRQELPDIYLNYTHAQGYQDFNKYLVSVQYRKRILGFGETSIRVDYGFIDRSIPYHKLFVPRGGLRNFSVVFHNTFETMRYNEFLADRIFTIFYSHNFGAIYVPFIKHHPNLEMIHNLGRGALRNKAAHQGIDFREFDRLYMESGLFVNNVIPVQSLGQDAGLGAGFFYRYGTYQNARLSQNLVFKVSLSLGL